MNDVLPGFVSVIIPVFNDKKRLELCLTALEDQTYPQDLYEIIVVDNGSDESVEELVNQFSQPFVTYENERGSYAARNKGISISRGELLAFTDSDCIPAQNWLETAVKHLLSLPNYGIVAGRIEFFFQNPNYPNSVEILDTIGYLQQKKYAEKFHFGATANLFTFKKVFEDVGYFNSKLKSGGDREWCKRAFALGYPVIYADNSCVAHPARYSLAQLSKKNIRVKRGHYDINKNKNKNKDSSSNLRQFISYFYDLKPPLRYAWRKTFSAKLVRNNQQRIELFFIIIFIHYVKFFAVIRLQLGALFSIKGHQLPKT